MIPNRFRVLAGVAYLVGLLGCAGPDPSTSVVEQDSVRPDVHSFARPDEVAVEHMDLDLRVDFNRQVIDGKVSLFLQHKSDSDRLWLDVRDLDIHGVFIDEWGTETDYELGPEQPFLGQSLSIVITPQSKVVYIDYSSRPEAAALQWLNPEQTTGGKHPFLLSQSQAILARTWIPCQDTPGVRATYSARVEVPVALRALMSAENPTERSPDGVYNFKMPQAIPSYLLALAVGDLEFRSLGPRSGVYAEPSVVDRAAWEFADTEAMMDVAEKLYGPYRWGRYDTVVLPPSFPYGGMENPRLTFATPTILAGDRSLVSLVAHELAHSWSGNLVTNATWNDFWLNEGFTTYFELRIMEALYGREYSEMLAVLGEQSLLEAFDEVGFDHRDTHLFADLDGKDPDDGMSDTAYEKGYLFLRMLEEQLGRARLDVFLREYFEHFAFQSMTSKKFVEYLRDKVVLASEDPEELELALLLDAWIYGPGLPPNRPRPSSRAFYDVELQIEQWRSGARSATELDTADWTTHEWIHFLRNLPEEMEARDLAELDAAFGFSEQGNAEVLCAWLVQALTHDYRPADAPLEKFLLGMGRRKFLEPLYTRMARTPAGLERAREIYRRARPAYHSVSTSTVDEILD